jgi:hypothetical protein
MSEKENSIKTTANTLTIRLYVEMIKEGEYFVAHCPALELSSYGKDEGTAKKRFGEELEIFFEETLQKGTLEKYLLKMGWTLRKRPVPEYTPPENNTKVPSSFIEDVVIPVC